MLGFNIIYFFLYCLFLLFRCMWGDSLLLIIRWGHYNLFKKKAPVVFYCMGRVLMNNYSILKTYVNRLFIFNEMVRFMSLAFSWEWIIISSSFDIYFDSYFYRNKWERCYLFCPQKMPWWRSWKIVYDDFFKCHSGLLDKRG